MKWNLFDTPPNHAETIIISDQNGIEFEHWFMLAHLSDFQGKINGVYNYSSIKYCKINNTYHGIHLFSKPCKCNSLLQNKDGHYDWFFNLKKPFKWRYK